MLATLNHEIDPAYRSTTIPTPIAIGKNVWIGANTAILSGVTIGDGALVAAGAMVTREDPVNVIVGCVPAKIIKAIDVSREQKA